MEEILGGHSQRQAPQSVNQPCIVFGQGAFVFLANTLFEQTFNQWKCFICFSPFFIEQGSTAKKKHNALKVRIWMLESNSWKYLAFTSINEKLFRSDHITTICLSIVSNQYCFSMLANSPLHAQKALTNTLPLDYWRLPYSILLAPPPTIYRDTWHV